MAFCRGKMRRIGLRIDQNGIVDVTLGSGGVS